MSSSQLFKLCGWCLFVGAVISAIGNVGTSVMFPDNHNLAAFTHPLFVPLNLLAVVGTVIILIGLPGLYLRHARQLAAIGLAGLMLIFLTGILFGVFLSLVQVVVLPYLAAEAPTLATGDGPPAFFPLFLLGLACQVIGSVLFALPIVRGAALPRWLGYLLVLSALLAVAGFLVNGPDSAPTALAIAINVLSPVLLFVVLGWFGFDLLNAPMPAGEHAPATGLAEAAART